MLSARVVVERVFAELLQEEGHEEVAMEDGLVLLESGLDSLGFAVLVSRLEDELGYDPFSLMQDAVYPKTLGELQAIYERYWTGN